MKTRSERSGGRLFKRLLLPFLVVCFVFSLLCIQAWFVPSTAHGRFVERELKKEVSPCVLEIRQLASDLAGKNALDAFPAELDALFRLRTRATPPGLRPFHVFVSTDPSDWLPPYGTRTCIVVVVENFDDLPRRWSASDNGIVISTPCGFVLPAEVAGSPKWRDYVCYWPKTSLEDIEKGVWGSGAFWTPSEDSPLWNPDIRGRYGSDKLLLPPDRCWP